MVDEYEYQEEPVNHSSIKEVIDSYPDLLQWFNSPEANKFDEAFIKDIVLSNLNEQEVSLLRNFLEFTRELSHIPELNKATKHFVATLFDLPIVSNAKGGFARKEAGRTRHDQTVFEKREEPSSNILNKMKRNRWD